MVTIERLVFEEPTACVEVFAGTFYYRNSTGEETEAKFFVKTCELDEEDESATRSRREDDLNEQLTDQWSALMEKGCTNVKYAEARPNPFF